MIGRTAIAASAIGRSFPSSPSGISINDDHEDWKPKLFPERVFRLERARELLLKVQEQSLSVATCCEGDRLSVAVLDLSEGLWSPQGSS